MPRYRSPGADLSGRNAVVTGANGGMGKETARELARMGAHVVLGCRNLAAGTAAAQEIAATTGNGDVCAIELDLASRASVAGFAEVVEDRFGRLDILVHNAAASLRERRPVDDGFEATWATNVLGPYLLTRLLHGALRAGSGARVVAVSTIAAGGLDLSDTQFERRSYSGTKAYRASKQAFRMLCWELAADFAGDHVAVNALNPGYVASDLSRNAGGPLAVLVKLTAPLANSPLDGADTAIWLAASPEVEGATAKFFSRRREIRCRFRDPAETRAVRDLAERQLERLGER